MCIRDSSKSYNDKQILGDVIKVRKDLNPMTPSKKVFDVSLPDRRSSIDKDSYNKDEPTKLDFTDANDEVNLDSNSNERQSIISNVERSPTPPLRRSGRERRPIDILDPSPSLTQVGKSRMCNKKLRRSNSPPKKFPMKRPPTSRWTKVYDGKVLDEFALVQFCLLYTSPSPRDVSLSRMPSSA